MWRVLPPAGHPIPARIIFKMLKKTKLGGSDYFFKKMFPGADVFLVSSGTAALTLALKSIAFECEKREVIIPAYSCPSVAAAVIKNNLRPVLCDIHPKGFQFDTGQLKAKINDATLAIVGVHLFGIPQDIDALKQLAEEKRVLFIEDACQAFGNRNPSNFFEDPEVSMPVFHPYLGAFGDIGILSFGRGKPLSLLSGGAVIVNNGKLVKSVHDRYDLLPVRNNFLDRTQYILQLIVYVAFFHPRLYWIPKSMPLLKLGETIFSTDFSVERAGRYLADMGRVLIESFEQEKMHRMRLAMRYAEAIHDLRDDFLFMPNPAEDGIALLRFPLILRSNHKRNKILAALEDKGFGATKMYPVPLNIQQGISGFFSGCETYPGANQVADGILTLPLHSHVSLEDCQSICRIIREHV